MVSDDEFWAIDRFRSSDVLLSFNGVSTVVVDASTVDFIFSSDVNNEGNGVGYIAPTPFLLCPYYVDFLMLTVLGVY